MKSEAFAITIQNKYSQLVKDMNGNLESSNDNLTVLESALEVGEKAPKENSGKLSIVAWIIGPTLWVSTYWFRYNDIRKYKKMIEETPNNGTSMKIVRTLGIGRKQLYALKDEQGQITNNRDEMIMVAEELYSRPPKGVLNVVRTSCAPLEINNLWEIH